MHEEWDVEGFGREIRGGRDIATETDKNVGVDIAQNVFCLVDRPTNTVWNRKECFINFAWDWYWVNHP